MEQDKDITGMLDRLSIAVDEMKYPHISHRRRLRYHKLARNQVQFLIRYWREQSGK
ncbi:MAG: hypothetical protein AAF518_24195 [Spirochaetota bacterium]